MDPLNMMQLRKAVRKYIHDADTQEDVNKNCHEIIAVVEEMIANAKKDLAIVSHDAATIKRDLE